MRRRLRRQQRVREALLLDLGALVYELHRHGRREPELLQEKAAELSAVDREVRALAEALEEGEALTQLVAAGIAGSCDACGSLLTTDARFCSRCGAPTAVALGEQAPQREAPPGIATADNGAGGPQDDLAELETSEHPAVDPGAGADGGPEAAESHEPEAQLHAESAAEPEPEAQLQAEPAAEPDPEPDTEPRVEPEPQPEPEPEPQPAEPEPQADADAGSESDHTDLPPPQTLTPPPPPPPGVDLLAASQIGEPVSDRAKRAIRDRLRRRRRWFGDRGQG
jgi:hypothetical protein